MIKKFGAKNFEMDLVYSVPSQFVRKIMKDILNTKELIHRATLGIPKGMKKM